VNFIERVMRIMTHVNIGVALGLVAWVMWSGWQVVTGQWAPGYRAAEVRALMQLAHAGDAVPMHLVPVQTAGGPLPPCHEAHPAASRETVAGAGADL
jgi:hypothetical protein